VARQAAILVAPELDAWETAYELHEHGTSGGRPSVRLVTPQPASTVAAAARVVGHGIARLGSRVASSANAAGGRVRVVRGVLLKHVVPR